MEIARRIERIHLLPVPQPVIPLEAAPELSLNLLSFPVVVPTAIIDVSSGALESLPQLPRAKVVQLSLFASML
jgi:hypothetical protein